MQLTKIHVYIQTHSHTHTHTHTYMCVCVCAVTYMYTYNIYIYIYIYIYIFNHPILVYFHAFISLHTDNHTHMPIYEYLNKPRKTDNKIYLLVVGSCMWSSFLKIFRW